MSVGCIYAPSLIVDPASTDAGHSRCTLGRGNSPAVNHILGARDRCGARRDQERDQVGYLLRPSWTTKRDAAQGVHDDLLATLIVSPGVLRQPLGSTDSRLGFDPPRRHPHHTDTRA